MDFKGVVSSGDDPSASVAPGDLDVNDGFTTCEAALRDYVEQKPRKSKQKRKTPAPALGALDTIHSNLVSYWTQYGILDKSSQQAFTSWAAKAFNFSEYRSLQSSSHV